MWLQQFIIIHRDLWSVGGERLGGRGESMAGSGLLSNQSHEWGGVGSEGEREGGRMVDPIESPSEEA